MRYEKRVTFKWKKGREKRRIKIEKRKERKNQIKKASKITNERNIQKKNLKNEKKKECLEFGEKKR